MRLKRHMQNLGLRSVIFANDDIGDRFLAVVITRIDDFKIYDFNIFTLRKLRELDMPREPEFVRDIKFVPQKKVCRCRDNVCPSKLS